VLERYASLTREALRAGPAALVVWPENAIQVEPGDPALGPALRAFAARLGGAPLLLGAPRSARGPDGGLLRTNAAHLLGPGGAAAHYDKIRLLPLGESSPLPGAARGDLDAGVWSAGREPGLLDAGGLRLGVLICLEATDPGMARTLARGGAAVLVNLSNDGWFRGRGGDRQHLQLARFRAIETGLPLLRATTTGVTAVIAPDGALVAALPPGEPGVLRAALPARRPGATLYARTGDVLPAACSLVCVGAAALAASRARSPRAQPRAVSASP
jgi:apolipoprotein N-acyltransferase